MSVPRPATDHRLMAAGAQPSGDLADFEIFYRATVVKVAAFFTRLCGDPQLVADLTSETFVQAIASLQNFDPTRGSAKAWLFGIARRVWAQHCERSTKSRAAVVSLAARRQLGQEEIDELAERIDAQHAGAQLLIRLQQLPELDRAVVELVDLAGLEPREAASVLEISPGALRVRLFRARNRLRKAKEEQ